MSGPSSFLCMPLCFVRFFVSSFSERVVWPGEGGRGRAWLFSTALINLGHPSVTKCEAHFCIGCLVVPSHPVPWVLGFELLRVW